MPRWTLALCLLAACTGSNDDGKLDDTDLDDTDGGVESDRPIDTDDGDTDDTDDGTGETDVTPTCVPAEPSSGHQRGEPADNDTIDYRRVIDACAEADALHGVFAVTIEDDAGDRFCTFRVAFDATTADTTCDDCDLAWQDVTWSGASFSDADVCALFALDTDYVAGLNVGYTRLGSKAASADLLYFDGDHETWTAFDATLDTVRERDEADGVTHLTLTFETTFSYGD